MKPIHVKIYCNSCGKLLLHERIELPDQPDPKNPLRQYVALAVDLCEDCLATLLIEKENTPHPEG